MPEDFSFINKLRMDNLYPVAPRGRIKRNNSFGQFQQEMNRQDQLDQIMDPNRFPHAPQNNIPPPTTKPMDVVFDQGNISETARGLAAARSIHGVDLQRNALSPYQAGQLANRNRELDIREQGVNETAEMGEFKRMNPGGKFVNQPDGNILYIGPGGQTLGNFGPSGKMAEERRIGLNQQNAIQRLDRGGEITGAVEDKRQYGRERLQGQRDLASMARTQVTAGSKPIGTTRDVAYKYGPGGEIIGATSNTKQVLPTKVPGQGTTVTMYGPNGEGPYPVPTEKTDEYQEKYGMTFTKKPAVPGIK